MNKEKKKIGVITLQNVRNYGSVLQALATQEIFGKLGYEAWFYDYYRKEMRGGSFSRARSYTKNSGIVSKIAKTALLVPTFYRQDRIFGHFLKRHLNTIEGKVTSEEEFKRLGFEADVYCTGSDQTWNSGWNSGILHELFLSFVPEGKRCIAYAASFGKNQLEEWEKNETKELLEKYSAISVREKSAVDIIKDLNIPVSATHVLDPTLQVDSNFWRKLSHPVKYKNYCLLYQLNHNREFDKWASEIAHKQGLKLIRWCNRYDQLRLPADIKLAVPGVEDFISMIDHADLVLTDSFHCTAFSTNLNKQFLSVYPDEYSSRLASLLKLVGLEYRHVSNLNDYNIGCKKIDFAPVNDILDTERQKAFDFLKKALS